MTDEWKSIAMHFLKVILNRFINFWHTIFILYLINLVCLCVFYIDPFWEDIYWLVKPKSNESTPVLIQDKKKHSWDLKTCRGDARYCFLPSMLYLSNFHTVPATVCHNVLYFRSQTKFSYYLNIFGQFWRIFQFFWSILEDFSIILVIFGKLW